MIPPQADIFQAMTIAKDLLKTLPARDARALDVVLNFAVTVARENQALHNLITKNSLANFKRNFQDVKSDNARAANPPAVQRADQSVQPAVQVTDSYISNVSVCPNCGSKHTYSTFEPLG